MTEVKSTGSLTTTDLAYERTILAHERTLMAWVRTAVSMISFGFTIYKFFQESTKQENLRQTWMTPRLVGLIMISFGFLSLLVAEIQHQAAVKKIKAHYPGVKYSTSSLLAILVLLFGFVMFLGALFRQ